MSELLRLQEETKKMLRSVLLPNKEGLLLSGESPCSKDGHIGSTNAKLALNRRKLDQN